MDCGCGFAAAEPADPRERRDDFARLIFMTVVPQAIAAMVILRETAWRHGPDFESLGMMAPRLARLVFAIAAPVPGLVCVLLTVGLACSTAALRLSYRARRGIIQGLGLSIVALVLVWAATLSDLERCWTPET